MIQIPIYQIDAFADKVFAGNPAAVCPLEDWLDDEILQKIAEENNLSETAFFVKKEKDYHIRWFTPTDEVRLCGHATLASAKVLFDHLDYKAKRINFQSLSGTLVVEKTEDGFAMQFPSDSPAPFKGDSLLELVDQSVVEAYRGKDDYLLILNDEKSVLAAQPNFEKIKTLDRRGLIISAPGDSVDFVSRCFYPSLGIEEDPATGSAHTLLTPYWAVRLNKNHLKASQLSSRGALIECSLSSEKIILKGQAKTYMVGKINLEI